MEIFKIFIYVLTDFNSGYRVKTNICLYIYLLIYFYIFTYCLLNSILNISDHTVLNGTKHDKC
jgi:hypothetical protein